MTNSRAERYRENIFEILKQHGELHYSEIAVHLLARGVGSDWDDPEAETNRVLSDMLNSTSSWPVVVRVDPRGREGRYRLNEQASVIGVSLIPGEEFVYGDMSAEEIAAIEQNNEVKRRELIERVRMQLGGLAGRLPELQRTSSLIELAHHLHAENSVPDLKYLSPRQAVSLLRDELVGSEEHFAPALSDPQLYWHDRDNYSRFVDLGPDDAYVELVHSSKEDRQAFVARFLAQGGSKIEPVKHRKFDLLSTDATPQQRIHVSPPGVTVGYDLVTSVRGAANSGDELIIACFGAVTDEARTEASRTGAAEIRLVEMHELKKGYQKERSALVR